MKASGMKEANQIQLSNCGFTIHGMKRLKEKNKPI